MPSRTARHRQRLREADRLRLLRDEVLHRQVAVQPHLVAAAALRGVERPVGGLGDGVDAAQHVGGAHGADGDRHLVAVDGRRADRVPEPLREAPQRGVGGDVGRDHAELLAAPPRHEVVRPRRRLEPAADLGQDPVAREMAVPVVERLEPVDVGHHQPERDVVALRARQLDLVHVEHVVPVREARQGVCAAAVLRLLGRDKDVGDVGQDAVHEQPARRPRAAGTSFSRTCRVSPAGDDAGRRGRRAPGSRAARSRVSLGAEPQRSSGWTIRSPEDPSRRGRPRRSRAAGSASRSNPGPSNSRNQPVVGVHAEGEQPLLDRLRGGVEGGSCVGGLARALVRHPCHGARPSRQRGDVGDGDRDRQAEKNGQQRERREQPAAALVRRADLHEPALPERVDGGRGAVRAGITAPEDRGAAAVGGHDRDRHAAREFGQRVCAEARQMIAPTTTPRLSSRRRRRRVRMSGTAPSAPNAPARGGVSAAVRACAPPRPAPARSARAPRGRCPGTGGRRPAAPRGRRGSARRGRRRGRCPSADSSRIGPASRVKAEPVGARDVGRPEDGRQVGIAHHRRRRAAERGGADADHRRPRSLVRRRHLRGDASGEDREPQVHLRQPAGMSTRARSAASARSRARISRVCTPAMPITIAAAKIPTAPTATAALDKPNTPSHRRPECVT